MRTHIVVDDKLFARAVELTGCHERGKVLREGIKALIERESARKLAQQGASQPQLTLAPRRRPDSED